MANKQVKRKRGRPGKYRKAYCRLIISWFKRSPFKPVMYKDEESGNMVVATNKNGDPVLMPCELPTLEGFAIEIGVHSNTLLNWSKENPEFLCAIKKAKDIQKNILVQNGLQGAYDKTFAIFVAKNVTDMRDQKDVKLDGSINNTSYSKEEYESAQKQLQGKLDDLD